MVSLRARNRFLRSMDSTKKKLRVAPNNSAVSLTSGARTNRVITRTIQNHSCAEDQRAIGEEAGRSARSSPENGRRDDPDPQRVPMCDPSGRSRSRDNLSLYL